ncbi:MAG TPA: dienelactone hydrolase family protein [Actinopolymorphaceae bacterium]
MPDITATTTVEEALTGYLATPSGEGPWPGVIILPEAFGLTGDIRRIADRFAEANYVAFAPALYSMRCVRRAFREIRSPTAGPVSARIEASRAWLARREECTGRVGIIGFCLGGSFALLAAPRYDFAAASVNYGQVPPNAGELLRGSCPIVASYGGRDRPLRGHARRLREALESLQIPHDVKEYPNAGHSFLNGQKLPPQALVVIHRIGFGYEPEAAADAWRRIFAFFDKHVRAGT